MSLPARALLIGFGWLLLGSRAAGGERPASVPTPPDPSSVERFGPAYRYPQAGWIVLHIEGEPYERGYQHGRLLAPEIAGYLKTLATKRSPKDPANAWREVRTMVNALFLRGYDKEYLEEMKGIADGATAAGAKFEGRPLDLIDVVSINSEIEVDFLDSALDATATGLESRRYAEPQDLAPNPAPPEHCSAFAANGPATPDGSIVFGHITMFNLAMVPHFNVWLDVKPTQGHRVLMQTYPGGIMSGMDYYLNDAGLLVAETTIHQTKFDPKGLPLASRIRKTLQYADSIDAAVATLKASNNGMYTNEWLLADVKTNEIAMFELGTNKSKLWRSGRDEWYGGTKGFYWGCNNAKDLDVRLETVASVEGRPANVVFHPTDRDKTWLRLYDKHKGKMTAEFGFEAFTTTPLAGFPSCDAKFTTSALAKELTTWALFGPPLGRTWEPTQRERLVFPPIRPLVGNDWTLLAPVVPSSDSRAALGVDLASVRKKQDKEKDKDKDKDKEKDNDRDEEEEGPRPEDAVPPPIAWHGTLLPKADGDIWLAAAFADYERTVAREKQVRAKAKDRDLSREEQDKIDLGLFGPRSEYWIAVRRWERDVPLAEIRSELTRDEWYEVAANKGTLLLAALRAKLGDDAFVKLLDQFGRKHAGQAVSTADFRAEAEALPGAGLTGFFNKWLDAKGLPNDSDDGIWAIDSFEVEPERALIVYGTVKETTPQREAAERLQRQVARRWSNVLPPIVADKDATDDDLRNRHVLLVGRPDSNTVAARFAKAFPVRFGPASFTLRGETYAHPATAVVAAGENPLNPRFEVVLHAGLSAEATWRCVQEIGSRESPPAEVLLLAQGASPRRMAVPRSEPIRAAGR